MRICCYHWLQVAKNCDVLWCHLMTWNLWMSWKVTKRASTCIKTFNETTPVSICWSMEVAMTGMSSTKNSNVVLHIYIYTYICYCYCIVSTSSRLASSLQVGSSCFCSCDPKRPHARDEHRQIARWARSSSQRTHVPCSSAMRLCIVSSW